jgi:hypothetical protein
MPKEKIPYESWSALNDGAILAEKERLRMAMPWRIWEISVARANNWGHAAFRKGELTRLCCVEDNPNNRLAVNRGMKILREMDRIGPDSTQFCVIVNRHYVWRGAGKGSRKDICAEPAHMDTRETPWSPTVIEPRLVASPVAESKPAEADNLEHNTDSPWLEWCPVCEPMLGTQERDEIQKIHNQFMRK